MLKNRSKKFYIVLAITLLLMFGFGFLPPFGQITPAGMKVLGVFLGAIFSWIMGEIIWSAILAFLVLTIYGFGGIVPNLSSFVGGQITGMMIAALLIGYALKQCGVIDEIALAITTSKWARKGPWVLAAAFFIATSVIAVFVTGALPVIVLMWALFYEVANKFGLKAHTPYVSYVIVGIVVLANCAQLVMPYSAMAVMCMGIESGYYPDLQPNLFSHIIINIILVAFFNVIFLLVGKLFIAPKFHLDFDETEPHKILLTKRMKTILVYMLLLVVLMLIPPLLPAGNPISVLFGTTLGAFGVLVLITLLMAITYVEGEPLLDLNEGMRNGVAWPLFFLVGSALLMSSYITSAEMGILATITGLVEPILGGHSSSYVLVVSVVCCIIMTNTINDVITITVLFPICAPFFVAAGGNIELLGYLFTAASVHGVLMPSGSPMGALIHGNTDWLTSSEAFKYVGIQELIVIVVMAIFGVVASGIF